mgnify:CR=1 FL=1
MNNYRRILKEEWAGQDDPSHDFAHIERVLASALKIQQSEGGDLDIIIPAVWFHDLINLPKDHPDRCNASLRSADRAVEILRYQTKIPLIIDAGIGQASDAVEAMQMGCDAVLINTAIAKAKKPFQMAEAMKYAVISGRKSFLSGRIVPNFKGSPSTTKKGLI